MAFTGQVLRFDQDAYWGLGIGASIMGRVPLLGARARAPAARRPDHRRRHAVALLLAARVRHPRPAARLRRAARADGAQARHQRVADAGTAGDPRALRAGVRGAGRKRTACPSCPTPSSAISSPPAWRVLAVHRAAPRSSGRSARRDRPIRPSSRRSPRPDFFFLWLYAALSLLPPDLETPLLLIGAGRRHRPPDRAAALLSGFGEKSWRRRPISVLIVLVAGVSFAALTRLGADRRRGRRIMDAWSGAPVPARYLTRPLAARAPGRARAAGQAVPQLPRARRPRRPARSGARRRGHAPDRTTSSSARCCRAAATCRPTART